MEKERQASGSHRAYRERDYAFAQLLLALRTRAALTQGELAEQIGMHRRSIQKWETGEAYPKAEALQRLIAALLRCGAFSPGAEHPEAHALWELAAQNSTHAPAEFDEAWFAQMCERSAGASAPPAAPLPAAPLYHVPLIDWGEAIASPPALLGREHELATLRRWLIDDRCHVVALIGLGGIGKSSLAVTIAQQAAAQYDVVLFRSLQNGPPLGEVLDQVAGAISEQRVAPPASLPDKIARLVQLFRERRCLLLLDNFESIMQPGAATGTYRPGYADYRDLLQRLSETDHQSCLLLTSREKPAELGPREGPNAPVRALALGGLDDAACQALLEEKEIRATADEAAALSRRYGGNPLALKLIGEPIQELFDGDVGAFLRVGDSFFNGVGKLLEQQFERLPQLEQALLYWLAITREPRSLAELTALLAEMATQRDILAALESLRRRLLIERSGGGPGFTLQPVIMEYVADRLVGVAFDEVIAGRPVLLRSHPLIQATAKEYVRRSQEQLIGRPLLERLRAAGGPAAAERLLGALLGTWRGRQDDQQGFGPGNAANLLRLLRGDLQRVDLSGLRLRQAYLQVRAQDARLASAHLEESLLGEAFHYSMSVALSADGSYLAAGTSSGELRLWRIADRQPVLAVQAHAGGVYSVALSADGEQIVTGGVDGLVKLWSTSGVCLAVFHGHTSIIQSVAIGSTGRLIASASQNGAIRLWDVASGTCRAVLPGHAGGALGIGLGADDTIAVSCGLDGAVRLWDTASGENRTVWRGHTGSVGCVGVSADGQIVASGGQDGTIRLWDQAHADAVATLPTAGGMIHELAISADGRRAVSASFDGALRLWDTASRTCLLTLDAHSGMVQSVAIRPDGQLIASSGLDGTVKLWDATSGVLLAVLHGYSNMVRGVALSGGGHLAASAGADGLIRLWDAVGGAQISALEGHSGAIWAVALSADGQVAASGAGDGVVRIWDVASGACSAILQGHNGVVKGVALSADGVVVASGAGDGVIRIWDAASGAVRAVLDEAPSPVRRVVLSQSGRLAISSNEDQTIRIWDLVAGTCRNFLRGHIGIVYGIAISADERLIVSGGGDTTLRLWDAESGVCQAILHGHTGGVTGVAVSADGQIIASGSLDGAARLWDADTGTCRHVLTGHTGLLRDVALSASGHLLATGGEDGMVRLWDTASGALLRELRPDRPYERMDITGLSGVTEAQRAALRALGAVEHAGAPTRPAQ
jgi:WD40 repeat protein/transcriptional regulator with XRE-family HTH domain